MSRTIGLVFKDKKPKSDKDNKQDGKKEEDK